MSQDTYLVLRVTGAPFDAESMRAAARRVVIQKRWFNEREGWTDSEDTLPARFFDDPLPGGVARGARLSREQLAAMIAAYRRERGLCPDGRLDDAERLEIEALVGERR